MTAQDEHASERGETLPADGGATRREIVVRQVRRLVEAIRNGSDTMVEDAVLQLSAQRRYLAPLGMVVGAFAMLFDGLKLLASNWRLLLIQVLPAMWIWVAMIDLKAHALHGRSFDIVRGPVAATLVLFIAGVTAASFYLNAVFAFAVARPGAPEIRPAFGEARRHAGVILGWGVAVGLALGVVSIVFARWGSWWFAVGMSVVIGLMMFLYVAMPSRLIGLRVTMSRADALKASLVGGALGAMICSPPYALARIGILMLGSSVLRIPGVILLIVGLVLQAGATGSVKAIKMSAKVLAGSREVRPDDTVASVEQP